MLQRCLQKCIANKADCQYDNMARTKKKHKKQNNQKHAVQDVMNI